jgi:hypothetical protein
VRVFVPPLNVGVAPSTVPLEDASVKLWARGEELVKSIVTLPAFALSELVVNMSIPLGFAAIEIVLPREDTGAGAGVDETGAGVLLAGGLLVLLEVVLVLELLPHPATASAARAAAARRTLVISAISLSWSRHLAYTTTPTADSFPAGPASRSRPPR